MRKTLNELAQHLKMIMPEIPETYSINPILKNISDEDNIKKGVLAYREFLSHLYDILINEGEKYDSHKKVAHEYEDRTTLSVYYPFLQNIKILLMNIGLYGTLTKDNQFLICNNRIFNEKLSTTKTLECLRFLIECGICIDGIDVNEKKQKLSDVETMKISYPNNTSMLIGLKVMVTAEKEFGTLSNQDIFLRCDYRALKNEETDVLSIVKDTIRPLPNKVQEFILQLHQDYLNKGVKCIVEIKGYWIYIKYMYKRKDIWGINTSLNNGFHINVKAQNMDTYLDAIETFPPFLKQIINKGYGCGRKIESIGHCNGGCRGMIIPLKDSVLDMRKDINIWFDRELKSL
ncbi:MAG: hypothetical protein ACK5LC_14360 [Coprobacillaceae bacterium]